MNIVNHQRAQRALRREYRESARTHRVRRLLPWQLRHVTATRLATYLALPLGLAIGYWLG